MIDSVEATEVFQALVASHLQMSGVSMGRMFGSSGLKIGGKVFAMLVKGELVVKLPRDRVDELVKGGTSRPFDPGHGRPMKEWVSVGPALTGIWPSLVGEARAFVELTGSPASTLRSHATEAGDEADESGTLRGGVRRPRDPLT